MGGRDENGLDDRSTTWTRIASDWTPLPQQEGYDFQIHLQGTAVNANGNYGQVRIDNLRGEWND